MPINHDDKNKFLLTRKPIQDLHRDKLKPKWWNMCASKQSEIVKHKN